MQRYCPSCHCYQAAFEVATSMSVRQDGTPVVDRVYVCLRCNTFYPDPDDLVDERAGAF